MSVKSSSDKSLVISPEIRIAKQDPPPDLKQLWQHLPTNDEEEELSQHLPTTEHICNDSKQLTVGFAQTSTETITQGNPQQSADSLEQSNQQSGDFSDNANGASV